MEGLGALSCYMANPPVIARWERSGTQERNAGARRVTRDQVVSGFHRSAAGICIGV